MYILFCTTAVQLRSITAMITAEYIQYMCSRIEVRANVERSRGLDGAASSRATPLRPHRPFFAATAHAPARPPIRLFALVHSRVFPIP